MASRITKGQVKKLNTPIVVPKSKKKKKVAKKAPMKERRNKDYWDSRLDRLPSIDARHQDRPTYGSAKISDHIGRGMDGQTNRHYRDVGLLDVMTRAKKRVRKKKK